METADLNRGASTRPTPAYVKAMANLLQALRDSPTRCERCHDGIASTVRTVLAKPQAICRQCATRLR